MINQGKTASWVLFTIGVILGIGGLVTRYISNKYYYANPFNKEKGQLRSVNPMQFANLSRRLVRGRGEDCGCSGGEDCGCSETADSYYGGVEDEEEEEEETSSPRTPRDPAASKYPKDTPQYWVAFLRDIFELATPDDSPDLFRTELEKFDELIEEEKYEEIADLFEENIQKIKDNLGDKQLAAVDIIDTVIASGPKLVKFETIASKIR